MEPLGNLWPVLPACRTLECPEHHPHPHSSRFITRQGLLYNLPPPAPASLSPWPPCLAVIWTYRGQQPKGCQSYIGWVPHSLLPKPWLAADELFQGPFTAPSSPILSLGWPQGLCNGRSCVPQKPACR